MAVKRLLPFSLMLCSTFSFACSCAVSPFLQMTEIGTTDNIVNLRVLRYEETDEGIPTYMEVEIIRQFRGMIESNEIRVYGNSDGFSCIPFVVNYDVNTEWVIPLQKIDGSYWLPSCASSLAVEEDEVVGDIDRMSLNQFDLVQASYHEGVAWALKVCKSPWIRCEGIRSSYNPENGELVLPTVDILATPFTYGVQAKMKLESNSPLTFIVTEVE